jgi:hypothetical protein
MVRVGACDLPCKVQQIFFNSLDPDHLADPIALPQTKQGCAHGDYLKSCKDPLTLPVRIRLLFSASLNAPHNIIL